MCQEYMLASERQKARMLIAMVVISPAPLHVCAYTTLYSWLSASMAICNHDCIDHYNGSQLLGMLHDVLQWIPCAWAVIWAVSSHTARRPWHTTIMMQHATVLLLLLR